MKNRGISFVLAIPAAASILSVTAVVLWNADSSPRTNTIAPVEHPGPSPTISVLDDDSATSTMRSRPAKTMTEAASVAPTDTKRDNADETGVNRKLAQRLSRILEIESEQILAAISTRRDLEHLDSMADEAETTQGKSKEALEKEKFRIIEQALESKRYETRMLEQRSGSRNGVMGPKPTPLTPGEETCVAVEYDRGLGRDVERIIRIYPGKDAEFDKAKANHEFVCIEQRMRLMRELGLHR
jgi:hypothetical protein